MTSIDAAKSGRFAIGGVLTVNRLGFGAMRVTGPGIWGEPSNRAEALRTLKRLPEIGVDFVDTADSYGPEISEKLIREALYPYSGLLIATKAGFTRSGPDRWSVNCRPDHLVRQAHRSRELLGVERIDLWQLHRVDSRVPEDEQFAAVRSLIDEGVIVQAGLSEVSVAEIKAAAKYFPVATVQNHYNITDRSSEKVLDYCAANGIGFIPYCPLAEGDLTGARAPLGAIARKYGATPGQIALSWLLKRSPVMLPIPGTSKVRHLEENVAAANIALSDEDFAALDRLGRAA